MLLEDDSFCRAHFAQTLGLRMRSLAHSFLIADDPQLEMIATTLRLSIVGIVGEVSMPRGSHRHYSSRLKTLRHVLVKAGNAKPMTMAGERFARRPWNTIPIKAATRNRFSSPAPLTNRS